MSLCSGISDRLYKWSFEKVIFELLISVKIDIFAQLHQKLQFYGILVSSFVSAGPQTLKND